MKTRRQRAARRRQETVDFSRVETEKLQDLADLAHTFLVIHSAKCYGLVSGCEGIQVETCEEALREAKKRGIAPREDALERLMPILSGGSAGVERCVADS